MTRPSAVSKIRLLLNEELKKLDKGLNKLLPLEEIAVKGECALGKVVFLDIRDP